MFISSTINTLKWFKIKSLGLSIKVLGNLFSQASWVSPWIVFIIEFFKCPQLPHFLTDFDETGRSFL